MALGRQQEKSDFIDTKTMMSNEIEKYLPDKYLLAKDTVEVFMMYMPQFDREKMACALLLTSMLATPEEDAFMIRLLADDYSKRSNG